MSSKKEKIVDVTPEVIAVWKELYGEDNVLCIELAEEVTSIDPYLVVPNLDEQTTIKGWIKKPDKAVLNYAMQKLPNIQDAGKVIIRNGWLGGDDRIMTVDSLANSAALVVLEEIKIHQGRLKKA